MNKTEIRKRLRELLEKLDCLKADFEDLKNDVDCASGDIEPYEGRNDLTPQQEERQEWLEDLSYNLDDIIDLDTSELEDKAEGC